MGHSGILGTVPSCLPSIKHCQSGKVSEEKCGLIALSVHFLVATLSSVTSLARLSRCQGGLWHHLVVGKLGDTYPSESMLFS